MKDYQTEVCVREISVQRLLETYYDPVTLHACCRGCPEYKQRWSCPTGVPETREFFSPYSRVYLIGVKVTYSEALRRSSRCPNNLEPIRRRTFGEVKLALHDLQLGLERFIPGATSIAAGRCEQCAECTRPMGLPCAKPERMRYSFSAFRFDLGRIAKEEFGMPLKWDSAGLPAYNVILAAVLVP